MLLLDVLLTLLMRYHDSLWNDSLSKDNLSNDNLSNRQLIERQFIGRELIEPTELIEVSQDIITAWSPRWILLLQS